MATQAEETRLKRDEAQWEAQKEFKIEQQEQMINARSANTDKRIASDKEIAQKNIAGRKAIANINTGGKPPSQTQIDAMAANVDLGSLTPNSAKRLVQFQMQKRSQAGGLTEGAVIKSISDMSLYGGMRPGETPEQANRRMTEAFFKKREAGMNIGQAYAEVIGDKTLTKASATEYLRKANGDRTLAEKLARADGFEF